MEVIVFMNKIGLKILVLALVVFLAIVSGGCGGGSSRGGGSANLTAGSTVALDFDDEEGIYDVFLAEYNGWNNVDAAQTPYAGSVSVPAFIYSMKLPDAATPDVISVDLSAGTEYTVEFSKNLCESLGTLLPDIRLYAPDGSEVSASSFELTVYPEEDPSIICLTFTPSAAGIYRIQVFNAAGDIDNNGYVLRVYKEMRNPEADNKAGYPVRYTVSNSSGKTVIVTVDDIILFRRLLLAGVEAYDSYFNFLPVSSTADAEVEFMEWATNVQHHYGVYEEEDEEDEEEVEAQSVRTAAPVIVYDTTEIESELLGIPYDPSYTLGTGFNAITNLAAATKTAFDNDNLESLMPKSAGTPSTKFSYKFVSTQTEMENEMGTQASLSLAGNALGLSSSSSTNYKFGITSTTLLIRYSELEPAYRELPKKQLVLVADAKDALDEGSDAFREDYGDYYVSGYQYGGSYLATLTITTNTTEQLDKMKTGITTNLKDSDGESVVSGDFSNTMKNLMKENSATVSLQTITHGMSKDPISMDFPATSGDAVIDEMVKGLRQFRSGIASHFSAGTYQPVFVKLSRFRSLPGMRKKIARDIPVSSDHSVNIMSFNREVMNMRGYFNVINQTDGAIDKSVVDGYSGRFNNVIDTVKVNKNKFYTDRTLIPALLPEVRALCKEMKALGDRYTFYRMLMQAQTAQSQMFGSGMMPKIPTEGIKYGYSSFACSTAVTEDINAGSSGGKMRKEEKVEPNWAKNPAPADRWNSSFNAGDGNIFCYLEFTTDNKDGDDYRQIQNPCVGRQTVRFDLQSGTSRSYGFRFDLMPMRFDTKNYPITGLK